MARVRVGLTCAAGHFNEIGQLWEPLKDKDIDKLAERVRMPAECEQPFGDEGDVCGHRFIGLPHVEGRDREAEQLARIGGRNISAPLQSKSKAKPREGPLTPEEWGRAVWNQQRRDGGSAAYCAVTGRLLTFHYDHAHHVLEKRLLRDRGLYDLVWDPRNGLFIMRLVHERHTTRAQPITRDKLPQRAWDFAEEVGPWAVSRLESDYPQPEGET